VNLASILLKSIIANSDIDTWAESQYHYFPSEYSELWKVIDKYVQNHGILPTFESINLSLRDGVLRERFSSLEKVEDVEVDGKTLLEYLKNEYTQIEIMSQLEKYLEDTIAIESAAENIEALQNIVLSVEDKVDLKGAAENMRKMELFYTEEDLALHEPLGLNGDYDRIRPFAPSELILIGGRRGAGKSTACCNIASNVFAGGHSVMYFTIEMDARSIMQRCCSIATGVPAGAIRNRNLSLGEWQLVAQWWSTRFEDGERVYNNYLGHRDFTKFHKELTLKPLRERQLDIIYNSSLTLANIRTELDKKMNKLAPRVVVVDYINQVKRGIVTRNRMGQYDWTEQIEISKALKSYAQDYNVIMVSPYQIDGTGEARFAKGILDAADAAFTLDVHDKADNIITFNCAKMRNSEEISFTSTMDWVSLKIGPSTGELPKKDESSESVHEVI
jgi:hypothetical protein